MASLQQNIIDFILVYLCDRIFDFLNLVLYGLFLFLGQISVLVVVRQLVDLGLELCHDGSRCLEVFAELRDSAVQLVYFFFEFVSLFVLVFELGRELVYFVSLLQILGINVALLEAHFRDLFLNVADLIIDVLLIQAFLLLLIYQALQFVHNLVPLLTLL